MRSYLFLFSFTTLVLGTNLPEIEHRTGPIKSERILLKKLDTQHQYSLLYSAKTLRGLPPDARVNIEVAQNENVLAAKTLHAGDADFYTQFRPRQAARYRSRQRRSARRVIIRSS